MQVLRRTVVGLFAASILLTLVGCGGLGVNIGSGAKGSDTVTKVTIFVISGPNSPIVLAGHTLTMQAIAYDSRNFVSSTQGAVWSFANGQNGTTGAIVLFNGDCTTPYSGAVTQSICVFGTSPGTVALDATVQGVLGGVFVTIQ